MFREGAMKRRRWDSETKTKIGLEGTNQMKKYELTLLVIIFLTQDTSIFKVYTSYAC